MSRPIALMVLTLFSGCFAGSVHDEPIDNSADSMLDSAINRYFEFIPIDALTDADHSTGSAQNQFLSMVGREDLIARAVEHLDPERACIGNEVGTSNILAEIQHRAIETRIVIINEAHDQPYHRDFIRKVAIVLWDAGYRIYAAETFSPLVAQSQDTPYVNIYDGFYSNEPVFGELVREVKRLGYRLLRYEHSVHASDTTLSKYERAAIREEGQSENLAAVVAGLDEGARLLVHVGYSHASEVPIESFGETDFAWMATLLKEKTGIDPLTIDQTKCDSNFGEIRLLRDAGNVVAGQFDLQIAHPVNKFIDGRPEWRARDGARRVDIPKALLDSAVRVIVEARLHGEPHEAVPVDRILLWPNEILPLLLAPGIYDLVAFGEGTGLFGSVEGIVVR